jgi:hypothetical protein
MVPMSHEDRERVHAIQRALAGFGRDRLAPLFAEHVRLSESEEARRCAFLNAESALADLRGEKPPGCSFVGFSVWLTEYRHEHRQMTPAPKQASLFE